MLVSQSGLHVFMVLVVMEIYYNHRSSCRVIASAYLSTSIDKIQICEMKVMYAVNILFNVLVFRLQCKRVTLIGTIYKSYNYCVPLGEITIRR